jgi:biotin operon repressor
MEAVSVARKLDTKDHKAIWCAVRRLRRSGWVIEGVPGIGYQLIGFLHHDPAALRRAADYLEASG